MAEYIERERPLRKFNIDDMMNVNGTLISLSEARETISNFPAADVAPVVRCKDCKHSWEDIGGLCCSHGVCVDCTVPEDFFCADGERKNDFVDDNKIGERRTDER